MRYYHPELQRFTREDPIEFEGGDVNLYAYVWNNPLSSVDPYGLYPVCGDNLVNCPPSPPGGGPPKTKSGPGFPKKQPPPYPGRYPPCPGHPSCRPPESWNRPYPQPKVTEPDNRGGDIIYPGGWWIPKGGFGPPDVEP